MQEAGGNRARQGRGLFRVEIEWNGGVMVQREVEGLMADRMDVGVQAAKGFLCR